MDLQGTSAIVTGGASGLGAATVERLAARGASVVAFDRHAPIGSTGGHPVIGDVTEPADVAHAIEVAAGLGRLAVLVNCAGIGSADRVAVRRSSGIVEHGDAAAFRRVIEVNLVGTYHVLSQGAAAIAAAYAASPVAGDDGVDSVGVIVNTASIAAFEGQVGQAAYAASKAAVVALTSTAARDLAPLRIRVNAIAPGLIDTPLVATVRDDIRQGLVESVVHPRRAGRPDEFARLVEHLVDNEYLNGEVIRLDGAARLPHRPEATRL